MIFTCSTFTIITLKIILFVFFFCIECDRGIFLITGSNTIINLPHIFHRATQYSNIGWMNIV